MLFSAFLTILGLSLFEAVSSVDNAIINAEVLHTMGKRARRWFLTWGMFIAVFLLLHWLFLEEKRMGLPRAEKFFMAQGVWFYAVVSILLAVIAWFALRESNLMGFGAVVGSTLFFITHGFKQNAEEQELKLGYQL